jgi:acyl dehydratase
VLQTRPEEAAHELEPRILRKIIGNQLEDFRLGQTFRHRGGKTVTEGLFAIFTGFSMTTNPLSKNARTNLESIT